MMKKARSWIYLFSIFLLGGSAVGQEFPDSDESEEIFELADVPPELIAGNQELYEEIASIIKYPSTRLTAEGKVYVGFIVEKDGSVTNLKVIKSLHPIFDEEVLRTLKEVFKTTKYSPGRQNGIPVRVQIVLPIYFKMNN